MKKILLSALGLVACGAMSAQTIVSTTTENRNVVLEEFTGIYCTFCPDGHKRANELKADNPGRVVLSNIHVGSYAAPTGTDPDYRTEFGAAIDGQAGVAGYPAGTVNREDFVASGWTQGSGTAMSRGDWDDAAAVVMAEASPVNVAASATVDVTTRVMTVLVEVYYTDMAATGTMDNLSVALLQNDVRGPQTGGSNFYPEQIDENGLYIHNHMFRHFLTGQWGEELTVADGPFFTRTYTYTLPDDINAIPLQMGYLEVIAFIADDNQNVMTGDYATLNYTGITATNDVTVQDMAIQVASTCGSVADDISFKLRNNGSAAITSAEYDVNINGVNVGTKTWTGSLNSLGQTTVNMDPIALSGVDLADEYVIEVDVTSINGVADETPGDNQDNTSLFRPKEGAATLTVTLTYDQYGSEVGYSIKKKGGPVVLELAEGSLADLGSATTATDVQTIEWDGDACFEVEITDSYGDGMTWQSVPGTGLVITDVNGTEIVNIAGDSYTERAASNYFHAEVPAGTEELENAAMKLYPNPANNMVTITGLVGTANVQIFDIQGRVVMNQNTTTNNLDVSGLVPGVYNVAINVDGATSYQKLSIIK
jgi:hypothetical protein